MSEPDRVVEDRYLTGFTDGMKFFLAQFSWAVDQDPVGALNSARVIRAAQKSIMPPKMQLLPGSTAMRSWKDVGEAYVCRVLQENHEEVPTLPRGHIPKLDTHHTDYQTPLAKGAPHGRR